MAQEDMSMERAKTLFHAADETATRIVEQLVDAGVDGPFGNTIIILTCAKWLARGCRKGHLDVKDLKGVVQSTANGIEKWTRTELKDEPNRG